MTSAAQHIIGEWVEECSICPQTNMYGRSWMTKDGKYSGKFYGPHTIPIEASRHAIHSEMMWYFTPEQCRRGEHNGV